MLRAPHVRLPQHAPINRRQVVTAMRASEQKLSRIFCHSIPCSLPFFPLAIFSVDAVSLLCVPCNKWQTSRTLVRGLLPTWQELCLEIT